MALERLEAGAPLISNRRLYRDPSRRFMPEKTLYQAVAWTKQESRRVYLKRAILYYCLVIHDKSARVFNEFEQPRSVRLYLYYMSASVIHKGWVKIYLEESLEFRY
jgi:hypothetical protein